LIATYALIIITPIETFGVIALLLSFKASYKDKWGFLLALELAPDDPIP